MSDTTMPFEMTVPATFSGTYELPPTGTLPAVLIGIIDLGSHPSQYDPAKYRHKLLMVWELTHEADSTGKNFIVAQDYTWSLAAKSYLRLNVVEGFLGRTMHDQEKYDLMLMLGKPCMVSLGEDTGSRGGKFITVTKVTQPMRGFKVNDATNKPFAFHLGGLNSGLDDLNIPEWVPRLYGRNVADDIKASREFNDLPKF